MSASTTGKHAGSGARGPEIPEPTLAERARTLVYLGRVGSLSTLSRKQPGFPFGSVMPYGLDTHANPIFLISTMAMHTQNLLADPRSSLLVTQPGVLSDPLGSARITLIGNVQSIPEADVAEARMLYLERHEESKYWVDYRDFAFYRMNIVDVYYVGGFGVMGWISAAEYYASKVDPLADAAPAIIQHMNTDHVDALVLLTQACAGITAQEATMTSVDRLGFHIRLKTHEGGNGARIAFLREVRNPEDVRKVLIEMVANARHTPTS
jgi:putative heme iron utilization protein